MRPGNQQERTAYGDFQTPAPLAEIVMSRVLDAGFRPTTIFEPTCGEGTFVQAALRAFPDARLLAQDINPAYVRTARLALKEGGFDVSLRVADFFRTDWAKRVNEATDPILFVGNLPWVTTADLSTAGIANLPERSNFKKLVGLSAKTGASNFDISEWMLLRLLEAAQHVEAMFAVLVKTSVARRVVLHSHVSGWSLAHASIRRFDSQKWFGASVDAGLFQLIVSKQRKSTKSCRVFASLTATRPEASIGVESGQLIANSSLYRRSEDIYEGARPIWRSGVKHDCAAALEFTVHGGQLINKLGEVADIEKNVVFPLAKGSDLVAPMTSVIKRRVLITQRYNNEDPRALKDASPKAWEYLLTKRELFQKRKSSIYQGKPQFSMFGIGDYSFTPWKIAISGFHKQIRFALVPPFESRPVMLDDTCYFIGCSSARLANSAFWLLTLPEATDAFHALIFWDTKRPITKAILDRVNLQSLARRAFLKGSVPPSLRVGVAQIGRLYGEGRDTLLMKNT